MGYMFQMTFIEPLKRLRRTQVKNHRPKASLLQMDGSLICHGDVCIRICLQSQALSKI